METAAKPLRHQGSEVSSAEADVALAAGQSCSVLITRGTSEKRDMIARGLHRRGEVATIICDEVSDQTFASSLTLCRAGTLVLKGIDRINRLQQSMLFAFMEGRQHGHSNHVRVIAASSTPLIDLVKAGQFYGALFYRLNVISVVLPE